MALTSELGKGYFISLSTIITGSSVVRDVVPTKTRRTAVFSPLLTGICARGRRDPLRHGWMSPSVSSGSARVHRENDDMHRVRPKEYPLTDG